MVIKTFNIDEEVYKQFSTHCKKNGVSMSKRVENFLREEMNKINAFVKAQNEKKAKIEAANLAKTQVTTTHTTNSHHTFSKYC
jgi:negative regulator of replication initiation